MHIPEEDSNVCYSLVSRQFLWQGSGFWMAITSWIRLCQWVPRTVQLGDKTNYCIYSNARLGFFLTFDATIWGCFKFACMCRSRLHQTQSPWTGIRRVKPRPSSPNHQVRAMLFWHIMQQRVVNSVPIFWDKLQPSLQRSRNANGRTQHNWS